MREKITIHLTKNERKTLKIAARASNMTEKKWVKQALILYIMEQLGAAR